MTLVRKLKPEQVRQMRAYAEDYIKFMRENHADRERVAYAERVLLENGYQKLGLGEEGVLKPGDKFFYSNYAKNLIAGVVGSDTLVNGIAFIGAHADYPHLDLKPHFVREMKDQDLVMLKTSYYGGIKKYMYTTVPLMIKGFLCKNGITTSFTIGDKQEDPVFTIPDLLIHLSADLMQKKACDVVTGEDLNVVASGAAGDSSVTLSANFYKLLEEKCGIKKEDVKFCEFQLFPAIPHRFVGLDELMIGGPGEDDGICCYSALEALLQVSCPKSTCFTCLYSYEETGSRGCAGANSLFAKQAIQDVFYRIGLHEREFPMVYQRSILISADVTTALDVNFASVHEQESAAVINRGIAVERYTGARGKRDTSEASTEVLDRFRRAVGDDSLFQFSLLGAVDVGGGGTIAKYISEQLNVPIIDVGEPILNMHSYFEISGIADLWSGIEVYKRIFEGSI